MARAAKASWVLNQGQRRLFARDAVEHKVTGKPNGTTFTRPTARNFALYARQPADKAWAQNMGQWKFAMVNDKVHDMKNAKFERISTALVRTDTSTPDWEAGQDMPVVYQWYNNRWAIEGTTPSYPNGVEVDVSQCDAFTPKQYVLYTGPPVGAIAAEKAALPGKGKSDKGKGKPLKGKLGNRAQPRMIDLVQRSSILGSFRYWNDRLSTSDMKYPMVSIHVADFGGHYPEATQWRQTGFLA